MRAFPAIMVARAAYRADVRNKAVEDGDAVPLRDERVVSMVVGFRGVRQGPLVL